MELPDRMAVAERILSERFGGPVRLREGWAAPGGIFSVVRRGHVVSAPKETPATVIVKAAQPRFQEDLFYDWAATQFLSGLTGQAPLAPRFYGGDREAGVIVLEDLGTGAGSPYELVEGNDPALAEQSLIEYITVIGRLHAATIGKSEAFYRLRDTLGPRPKPLPLYKNPWPEARMSPSPPPEVQQAIQEYHRMFHAVGLRAHAGVDEEIEAVTATVEDNPGPFLALCQGDQNGLNHCMRSGSGLRLFDFGAAGFRHALLEGMPHRITWGGMVRIPARLFPRLDKTYQAALAKGYPKAAEDAVFHRAMVEAGARWNIFHAIWRLPEALEKDRPRGPTSLRQQVLAWMTAFADMSEALGHRPALGKSARDLAARLRRQWPPQTHQLPYYPAFQKGGS